jgi:DNA-directed RNA polymerase subunit RPC12/RpoP
MRLVDIECSAVTEVIGRRAFTSRADIQEFLDNIPTAEAELVRHGKWIPTSTKPRVYAGMKCSECKARITYSEYNNGQHLYCHKCGARMLKE